MSVTIENVSPCRKKLRVEVAAERVVGERAVIFAEFRKAATLPGFRPGKAPAALVEKNFGKQIDCERRVNILRPGSEAIFEEGEFQVLSSWHILKRKIRWSTHGDISRRTERQYMDGYLMPCNKLEASSTGDRSTSS